MVRSSEGYRTGLETQPVTAILMAHYSQALFFASAPIVLSLSLMSKTHQDKLHTRGPEAWV